MDKRTEVFRIVTGIVAALAAAYVAFHFVQIIFRAIRYSWGWPLNAILTHFGSVALIAAMILCAVYAFALHGKGKTPILGVSALVFSGSQMLFVVAQVLLLVRVGGDVGWPSDLILQISIFLSANILTAAIYLIIALQYFNLRINHMLVKALPIVAISIAAFTALILPNILWGFHFNLSNLLSLLPYVPFLLFILLCAPTYRRVQSGASSNSLQESSL